MPALLDDPTSPAIYRTSGPKPYPVPHAPLPPNIVPRHVTLRDRLTAATLVPFSAPDQVPLSLVSYLCDQLNAEIEKGDTYPMISPMPLESFGPYWFSNFGAVMLLGDIAGAEDFLAMDKEGVEWDKRCLGTFYIKPNYPGRSSHVCNGGFIVTSAARNKGVGRQMGEAYLEWAPKLVRIRVLGTREHVPSTDLLTRHRATPTPSSIWFTRRTWHRAAFGMLSASKGSDVSRAAGHSSPIRTSWWMPSSMDET